MKRGTDMRIIHHERGRDPLYNIWNSSEECMIIYFYSGGGNVVFQNKIYPIKRGGLCFIRAGKQHYTLPDKPEIYDRSKIFVSEKKLNDILNLAYGDDVLNSLFRSNSVIYAQIPESDHSDVEKIYEKALDALDEKCDETVFTCCFFQLLIYLRDYSSGHITNRNDSLTRTIDFINRSYAFPITLDDVSAGVHMSKYYLCRRFKEALGVTIMEYLLKTRIAAAKNFLASDRISISEIAEKCGFSSTSYFSQIFKKSTGFTPIRYRNRFGENENS